MKTLNMTKVNKDGKEALDTKVRNEAKKQAMDHVAALVGLEKGANGNLFQVLATDERTGEPVFMTVEVKVTMVDPMVKKEKKAKAKVEKAEPEAVEFPDLFA